MKVKNDLFYIVLSLSFITISLPKYSLSSLSVLILLFFWLIQGNLKDKISKIKENHIAIMIISLPFILSIFGVFYSSDITKAISKTGNQAVFFLYPIFFLTSNLKLEDLYRLLDIFSVALLYSIIIGIVKIVFLEFNNIEIGFYYSDFSSILGKHSTYFSIFLLIAVSHCSYSAFYTDRKNRLIYLAGLVFFLIIIYFISVRISIITLAIILSFLTVAKIKKRIKVKSIISLIIFIAITSFFFMTPNFKKRFDDSSTHKKFDTVDYRLMHWKTVLEVSSQNWMFGVGTYGDNYNLFKEYKTNDLEIAYRDGYNAHNQLLESYYKWGILGLLMIPIMLVFLFFYSSRNLLSIILLFSVIIPLLTESTLERHSGIFITSIVFSFVVLYNKLKREKQNINDKKII